MVEYATTLECLSYYNSSSVCLFPISSKVLCVSRLTSHLPLKGYFSKRSTGRWVNGSLSLSTILYMCQPHATQLQEALLLAAAESNSASFAALHLNGVCTWTLQLPLRGSFSKMWTGKRVHGSHLDGLCRWTSQLPLRGSFSKRSTGRWFNRSNGLTGQRVTFTFTILYMKADDARLTPPRCKKHTAYDDTGLTPHHCKNHTASFARSTGKFPSAENSSNKWCEIKRLYPRHLLDICTDRRKNHICWLVGTCIIGKYSQKFLLTILNVIVLSNNSASFLPWNALFGACIYRAYRKGTFWFFFLENCRCDYMYCIY